MSLLKSGAVVAFYTFLSRIFGYMRDVLVASYLGTSYLADAFNVAFKLPNFFRTIFAEGALNAAFVPIFAGKISKDGKNKALHFASRVFTLLLIILIAFIFFLEMGMPYVMKALAPGFQGEKYRLVVELGAITVPYLIFISLASMLCGILNSVGKFSIAAAMPILLNVSMIVALVFFKNNFDTISHTLAYGVLVAGFLQLMLIVFGLYKTRTMIKIVKPTLDKDLITMLKNMWPAIIGSGVVQINLWIGTIIATTIPGAVSKLYYAERLNQFPLAIIGIAIGTVLLPLLSKQVRNNKTDEANRTQNKALEVAILLSLPCTFAYAMIDDYIISVLFERNAFSHEDTIGVSRALTALAMGLPAFVMLKIFTPRFFAILDTRTPVKASAVGVAVNIILSLVLINFFGHVGIAISTSLASWVNVTLLALILYKRNLFVLDNKILHNIIKIVIACAIMSLVLMLTRMCVNDMFITGDFETKLLILLGNVAIGGGCYLFLLHLFNVVRYREVKKYFLMRENGLN
jgi:putative peptidoglycan lipid II flippase